MRGFLLVIFYPVRAASNFGCFGVLFTFIYIIILGGIVLSVLGKMLSGCSIDDSHTHDYSSRGNTNTHMPYYENSRSSSSSSHSTYSTPPTSSTSIARSLYSQGYRIRQIRKYLKNNGYGEYRRKDIKRMIGKK